jgi:amino acid permease
MANAAMGAGVLAFPQAFFNSGIISGLVITIAMVSVQPA